jgi:uncharacterized membrane protein
MIKIALLIALYLLFPIFIILICQKWTLFKKLGSIVVAYGFGLLFGNIGILPSGSDSYIFERQGRAAIPATEMSQLVDSGVISGDDIFVNQISSVQDMILTIVIPLALPLLLFSLNIRKWLKYAKTGFLSMILALISVVVVIVASFFIFRGSVPETGKVAGMLVGIYTGGTPNVAAIKTALGVDSNLFLMTHTSDLVIGAIVIIFFITLAPRLFSLFLPKFKYLETNGSSSDMIAEAESMEDFSRLIGKKAFVDILRALGIALLIFTISAGVSLLVDPSQQMMIVILMITTLGLAASLIPRVNRIGNSFQLGMYLILIFSFVVSSMADLSKMMSVEYINVTLMVAFVVFGSLIIHLILAAIFKINVDDFLITTTALVYSPPFVPVVAGALRNKEIIITGLTVGIIGYAIGNYIGIFMGQFLSTI